MIEKSRLSYLQKGCIMKKTLLNFADLMWSWCWGFSPVMEKIHAKAKDKAELQIFVGGLRPFTEHVMTDQDKSYVRNHWDHVAEASGQPFDYALFDRGDFTYDTEPACRAVVTLRRIEPDLAPKMLARLHKAFMPRTKIQRTPMSWLTSHMKLACRVVISKSPLKTTPQNRKHLLTFNTPSAHRLPGFQQ